jgi:hypothetical protein
LVLVSGHLCGPNRASVPARHARHGGNVVAVSGPSSPDTASGNTCRLVRVRTRRAPDFRSGALLIQPQTREAELVGMVDQWCGRQLVYAGWCQ